METLRKDSFASQNLKGDRGQYSSYGLKIESPQTSFTAALDDVYGVAWELVSIYFGKKTSAFKHGLGGIYKR